MAAEGDEDGQGGLQSGDFADRSYARSVANVRRNSLSSGKLKINQELQPGDSRRRVLLVDPEVGVVHVEEDEEASQVGGARMEGFR